MLTRRCKDQTTACFSNPACLKGITCLGNCRGEQLCATQCFARFGSEKLNDWCGGAGRWGGGRGGLPCPPHRGLP
jgi:hypothetical protein